MSSQEVVDFIQSKITQKDENGVLRPLSSIVEEVRPRASPPLKGFCVGLVTLPSLPIGLVCSALGDLVAPGLEREQTHLCSGIQFLWHLAVFLSSRLSPAGGVSFHFQHTQLLRLLLSLVWL